MQRDDEIVRARPRQRKPLESLVAGGDHHEIVEKMLQQLIGGEKRIGDDRHTVRAGQMLKDEPAERGLAYSARTGDDDQALSPLKRLEDPCAGERERLTGKHKPGVGL